MSFLTIVLVRMDKYLCSSGAESRQHRVGD